MKTVIACCKVFYTRVIEDRLLSEASALTYQSFLAIVPLFAVMFGIAKGFGLETILETWIRSEFSDHQEMLSYLLQFSQTTLQEARGGIIAGIGVAFLLLTSIRLLSAVEKTLTGMWGISRERPVLRKVSDYLALILTCPILLTISSSITIYMNTKLVLITEFLPHISETLVTSILSTLPFATSAMLFSLILYAMPCAPVKVVTAVIAGSTTAIAFQCIQSWYIFFQLHLTKISAIYGSFVALPLFLVWLWISWLLVLIGGELLVFFHEKGWRWQTLQYTNSQLEQLELDVTVLTTAMQKFSQQSTLCVPDLYVMPVPIRNISQSIERLGKRTLIHESWSPSYSSTILPSQKAFSVSLFDLSIPELSASSLNTALAKKVFDSLSLWKKKPPITPLLEHLAQLPS